MATRKRKIYTGAFWLDTGERVIGTTAAAGISSFGGAELWSIDWKVALGITTMTAGLTTLKCIVAATIGDKGTASMLPADVQADEINPPA